MDSVSQIVLGSSLAAVIAHKQLGRSTLVIGAVLATLPDLDVLLPASDAVTRFIEHRSFSHSLFVLFPFAFLCFGFLKICLKRKFTKRVISNQRLFWLCCLPLVTHPMLDAFTSYGTQLFWPLTVHPLSIASIFAVDPLYTLPLLIGCVYLWRNGDNEKKANARRINHIGLILSSGYLLLGLFLQTQVQKRVEAVLQVNNIEQDKIFISPLYPSLNWWGAIVVDNGVYYNVEVNVLASTATISVKQDLGYGQLDVYPPALTSLDWFTNGFIRLENIEGQLVATDLRMKTGQLDYAFKFALAEMSNDGWKTISPLRL